jgi:hypothetical protein
MAKAFERAQSGHPRSTDPKMSLQKLRDFSTKRAGAPERAPQRYGSSPVSEAT